MGGRVRKREGEVGDGEEGGRGRDKREDERCSMQYISIDTHPIYVTLTHWDCLGGVILCHEPPLLKVMTELCSRVPSQDKDELVHTHTHTNTHTHTHTSSAYLDQPVSIYTLPSWTLPHRSH